MSVYFKTNGDQRISWRKMLYRTDPIICAHYSNSYFFQMFLSYFAIGGHIRMTSFSPRDKLSSSYCLIHSSGRPFEIKFPLREGIFSGIGGHIQMALFFLNFGALGRTFTLYAVENIYFSIHFGAKNRNARFFQIFFYLLITRDLFLRILSEILVSDSVPKVPPQFFSKSFIHIHNSINEIQSGSHRNIQSWNLFSV